MAAALCAVKNVVPSNMVQSGRHPGRIDQRFIDRPICATVATELPRQCPCSDGRQREAMGVATPDPRRADGREAS